MCQARGIGALLNLVPREALAVNPPESVLNCHRHRLSADGSGGLPFPARSSYHREPRAVLPLVHQ